MILNNEMDDFSTPGKVNDFGLPPSPANFIEPTSRPISSMCPFIVLDGNDDAVFISGSAGGSKITSTVAYVSQMAKPLRVRIPQFLKSFFLHFPCSGTC